MGGLNPIVHGRIRAVPVCGNGSAGAGIKASFRQIIWEQAPFPGLRLIQPAHTRSAMPAMREQLSRSAGAVFFHQEAENRRGTASAICKRGPPALCGQSPPLYLISLRVESGGSFSEVDHDILHLGVVLQNDLMGFAADA